MNKFPPTRVTMLLSTINGKFYFYTQRFVFFPSSHATYFLLILTDLFTVLTPDSLLTFLASDVFWNYYSPIPCRLLTSDALVSVTHIRCYVRLSWSKRSWKLSWGQIYKNILLLYFPLSYNTVSHTFHSS